MLRPGSYSSFIVRTGGGYPSPPHKASEDSQATVAARAGIAGPYRGRPTFRGVS